MDNHEPPKEPAPGSQPGPGCPACEPPSVADDAGHDYRAQVRPSDVAVGDEVLISGAGGASWAEVASADSVCGEHGSVMLGFADGRRRTFSGGDHLSVRRAAALLPA